MAALTIQGVIGPGVVCMWLSFILYGLILAQVYFYFSAYHDHILIRLTVVLVCALEGLQVAVLIHMMYTYLVVNFGDSEKTLTIIWSACVAVYLEVTIGVVVQSYYIWRIWMLNRNIFAVGYLVLVLLTRLIFGYWANTFVSIKGKWATLGASEGYVRIGSTGQSAGVLLDVSITSILLFSLYKSQGLALTRVTRNIVQKLMFYILGSGILTAIISVLSLILFVAFRTDIHYGGTLIILTKVYANSMLAMLNGRQGIRRDASRDNGYSVQLSDLTNSRMVFASPKTNAAQAEGAGEIRGTDDNWFSQGASTKGISCESNESPDPTVAAV